MLRRFSVTNYKNFEKTLVLDLEKVGGYKFNIDCIGDNTITKCLLYGRNATGKTNLGYALNDIREIISSVRLRQSDDRIINTNSDEEFATFSYDFRFGKDEVQYEYQRDFKQELVREKLFVNSRCVFVMNYLTGMLENADLSIVGAETIQLEKYLEMLRHPVSEMEDEVSAQVPFLRYILSSVPLMPDAVLKRMEEYIRGMRIDVVSNGLLMQFTKMSNRFNEYLMDADNLSHFEEFLNEMGIVCKLKVEKSLDNVYELYFMDKKPIPFYKNASSGTLTLTSFYRKAVAMKRAPSLYYMDEFDAFYNYEMSEKIVRYLKKNFPNSQIILTTHNTNLMTNQLMRPDCLFILSREGHVTALCDATERELREGHNLEKLYIAGEFEQYE